MKLLSVRPDAEDEKGLKEMAAQIRIKIAGEDISLPDIPGKVPEKPAR